MIRDQNNVRGALQKAASMGRGGDTQMAHVGKGEVLIPPEVIDTNPQVMAPLIKAFQKSGMDWRRYLVGSNQNSKNPRTGQKEFYAEAGASQDVRDRDAQQRDFDRSQREGGGDGGGRMEYAPSPTFEQALDIVDPAGGYRSRGTKYGGLVGAIGGGLMAGLPGAYAGYKAGQGLGGAIGGAIGSGQGTPGGPDANPEGHQRDIMPQTDLGQATPPPPPQVQMPAYLEFSPGMTPQQMRSQIATYGLNSDDSRYQTQESQDYYKSLLYTDLKNAGDLSALTPIEAQYLREVLGYDWGSYEELMNLLNPASTRQPRGFNLQRRF